MGRRKCCRLLAYLILGFCCIAFLKTFLHFVQNALGTLPIMARQPVQEDIDYIARNLQVKFDVLGNSAVVKRDRYIITYEARITLTNAGTKDIVCYPWELYLYEHHEIINFGDNSDYKVQHVNGDLQKIIPKDTFQRLAAGQSVELKFENRGYLIAKTSISPNWYIAAQGLTAQVIESTAGESLNFVGDFNTPAKWKRGQKDLYNPMTADERYHENVVKDLGTAPTYCIPTPLHVTAEQAHDYVFIPEEWTLVTNDQNTELGKQFIAIYNNKLALAHKKPQGHYILLDKNSNNNQDNVAPNNKEGYHIKIDLSIPAITVTSIDVAGLRYGLVTLHQILESGRVPPSLTITDAPRHLYRGFMLDVSRNFFPLTDIKQLIEVMGRYKLNRLHLHLADDEGWRLQIPDLEELTKVGAHRGHTYDESDCLYSTLGSGPETSGLGNGFYTVTDFQEIIQYAEAHGIQVIPEIDMPGHSHAAIIAMEARYKWYASKGDMKRAAEFLLTDMTSVLDDSNIRQDSSSDKVKSVQGQYDNALNPCLDSTYHFIEFVLRAIRDMYKHVSKFEVFHFGGDEVPSGVWEESPMCVQYLAKNHPEVSVDDLETRHAILKRLFIRRIIKITNSLGLKIQGWEDAFYGDELTRGTEKSAKLEPLSQDGLGSDHNVTTNVWMSTWERGYAHRPIQLANRDYKVVLSSATHLYFDHPHEPDPDERGLHWATRAIPLHKVFDFLSINYLDNVDEMYKGEKLTKKEACEKNLLKCIPLEKPANIIGLQAQLWTETVRLPEHLHAMIYPRLLAVAERGWSHTSWDAPGNSPDKHGPVEQQEWEYFINNLAYRELRWMEKKGIKYHLPRPGVTCSPDGAIAVNSLYPGFGDRAVYSVDKGDTWHSIEDLHTQKGEVWISLRYLLTEERGPRVVVTV